MRCSIVIPTLNEASTIERTLEHLSRLSPDEIIVSDGGSSDATQALAAVRASVVSGRAGRGPQLNAGASRATGDLLLFVHSDVILPDSALADIESAFEKPDLVGGCFRVRFGPEPHQKFVAASYDIVRMKGRGLVYGDSTIFARKSAFDEVGGYPDWPIMEDVNFVSKLRSLGRFRELDSVVVPSSRRWTSGGRWRTWASWWAVQLMFGARVSPQWLGRFYHHIR